ncbi:MAG: glycoside hydrolase family 13 protein [Clostridia bacterium]|nr:glycoside hydrolase family 13 protein [Clostridia bacterium]
MQVYRNFRDIPNPLQVKKTALTEKRAALFAAFPRREQLRFEISIDPAFATCSAFLRVHSDDDGRVMEFPFRRIEAEELDFLTRDRFAVSVSGAELCSNAQDGLFYYHVVADTAYGRLYSHGEDISEYAWFSDDESFAQAYQLTIYRDDFTTPDFLKTGVMYQIFVDRFFRGGNADPRADVEMAPSWDAEITQYPAYPGAPLKNNLFYGGDLDGVRQKLPYLRSLGVTVLYLCPIFEAYSNHKYDTGDYMRVDEMFGGRAALDRLLAEAKQQEMTVLLDGVFNHTGAISCYFNIDGRYSAEGAYQSTASPYYPWYTFQSYPDQYTCWWGVKILPTVDSSNPDYIRFVTGKDGVADTYLAAGIGGFRLDVADELHPDFLRALRRRIKGYSRENAVIGEVWEDASNKEAYGKRRRYFRGEELDSVMNYPLKNAIVQYLLQGGAQEFSAVTRTIYAHYPKFVSESLMNLLGTHDTVRILTILGGKDVTGLSYEQMKDIRLDEEERMLGLRRLRLAYAILSVMPGIPCIYYGDEAGMEGAKDPFNRRTFPWGREENGLLSFYRQMGKLRADASDILARGYYEVPYAEGEHLVLSREGETGRILLLVNAGNTPFSYPVSGSCADLMTQLPVSGEKVVPPLDFCLLRVSF